MDPTRPSFAPLSYDDFLPPSDWVQEEGLDTLLLELPGFTKEHLKVQLDNFGKLRVSGERPLGGNRRQRFRKEFHLPESCNTREIRAKFENGMLIISLPKLTTQPKAPAPAPQTQHKESVPQPQTRAVLSAAVAAAPTMPDLPTSSTPQHKAEPTEPTAPVLTIPKPESTKADSTKEDVERLMERKGEEKAKYGLRRLGVGLKVERRQLLVNISVAVIVLAGIGIYVAYKLKKAAEAEMAHYEL